MSILASGRHINCKSGNKTIGVDDLTHTPYIFCGLYFGLALAMDQMPGSSWRTFLV